MEKTRQSSHILMRSSAFSLPANMEWSASRSTMRSIEAWVPNGLPHWMQWNGSSSLITAGVAASAEKLSRGFSAITDSGQVLRHRPHWIQACSLKRSIGLSGLSRSAPVGQAPTQARQRVQPSTLTSSVPKGAPAGSGSTA